MTGAVALAIVLVIAVVGMSLALQSQKAGQSINPRPPRAPRPTPPPRRSREREQRPSASAASPKADQPEPEPKLPELLNTGATANARVMSVVDERTIGPVTRSRLTLRIEPEGEEPFEVTTRVAFPTPIARAAVKVGGTVPVRYDKDDHSRVVVDMPMSQ